MPLPWSGAFRPARALGLVQASMGRLHSWRGPPPAAHSACSWTTTAALAALLLGVLHALVALVSLSPTDGEASAQLPNRAGGGASTLRHVERLPSVSGQGYFRRPRDD